MIAVGFARIIFAIWCALGTVCSAWELDKEHPPTGELGVRLDYHLARTWPTALVKKGRQIPRTFTWSSHLTFEKDVSALEPSDLWQIAHDAYAEMKTNMALYKVTAKKDTPRAMTVLAVGNEIFLASSMKNGANFAFAYPKTKVSTTLEQCQTTFHKNGGESTKGHKNQASCGEVMSAQMYYTTEKNKDTLLEDREARVCTVVLDKEDNPQNTDPCSDLQTWGCNLFVKELGVKVVDKGVERKPFDLVEKMGKPVIDQIPLCAADYKPPEASATPKASAAPKAST